MKLELKHLAPYLPYGLKSYVDYDGHKLIKDVNVNNVMCIVDGEVLSKPILRPLSDLTKDITIGNDVINFQTHFNQYDFEWLITSNNKSKLINSLDYFIVSKMLEHHFDIFGLIEQGLAIDINTLK